METQMTTDRILGPKQAAERLGISDRLFWTMVADGRVRKPRKAGRLSKWRESELLEDYDRLPRKV